MFSKFLLIVGLTAFLFLAGGFFLPRYVHVERSLEIERPAAPVFALLNSYSTFASWSPWAERDPDAIYEFTGPEAGVGARMNWSGDPRLVGSGWQEIIESVPHSLVRTRLYFDQQGAAESYFELTETEKGVWVTWGFDTDLTEGQSFLGGLLARYFGLMFDRWIGTDYEQGLARLKAYAEELPATPSARAEIEIIEAPTMDILYVTVDESRGNPGSPEFDIAAALSAAFQEVAAFMTENGVPTDGKPMAINRTGGERGYELLAAIPYRPQPVSPSGRIKAGKSPSGPAVRIVHRGPYASMATSYEKMAAYMDVHELKEGAASWEHYVSDPAEISEDQLVTLIYFQISP